MTYDAIVLGVGGMGSAALCHLARRGRRVLGVEQFGIPHEMGSSHGLTRIIRLAYYENSGYVPLLQRAFELWRELEIVAGEQLLHVTGSLDIGPRSSDVVKGSLRSCLDHDLPHELLDSAEIARRFPGYQFPEETVAVLQPDGGFLLPERCIVAHVDNARAEGAEVHIGERVLGWEPAGGGVRVRTNRGEYEAGRLVVTAGAWAGNLLPRLRGLAQPERQVVGWFEVRRPELFAPDRFPVFNALVEEGRYYGFPQWQVPGFKLGRYHHLEQHTDADGVDRSIHEEDETPLRVFAERYTPDAAGPLLETKVCMFTNSPDEHFIIDLDPEWPQVVMAAGFSGHGFKFCSVVGEILADLALKGETIHDIGFLRLARFDTARI